MVTTDDPTLAKRVARLRVHGMEPKYHHHEVGFNSRLDALQAAVLRVKLRHLDAWTEARRAVAARYRALFAEDGLDRPDRACRSSGPGIIHVYNQFVVRVPAGARDPLRAAPGGAQGRDGDLLPDPAPPPDLLRLARPRARRLPRAPRPPRARRSPCRSTPS